MKLIPSEKDTLERLARVFREEEVLAPHSLHNHSNYYLIDAKTPRAAHTVAELLNHDIESRGDAPIAFPVHVAGGAVYDGSGTKNWLAVDIPAGMEEAVLETIESAPRRIRALLDAGTPKQQLQR